MAPNVVIVKKKIPFSETDLIARLRLRNEKAFSILYTAYSATLFDRIKNTVGCRLASEEILQNVFLKIWLNINNYHSEKSSLYTWMISITRNESIDYLRSKFVKKKKLTCPIDENEIKAKVFMVQKSEHIYLLKSLSLLPYKERRILELFSIGYTCREISELFALPEGTVKTNMRRSYVKLREILGEPNQQYHAYGRMNLKCTRHDA
ncbi:MAG: RNA polymerase sigma factor [Ferruginibacter sp.]|nr:RNA polymerase sigma factor [Ferruginibacter sp.]